MINELIINTLKHLDVPVAFRNYSGKASTYITFFCYNEQGETWAENQEKATGYYVQVDLWSKVDYSTLAGQIQTATEEAGFKRSTAQDMPYEPDTALFHKAMRFSYLEGKD